MYPTPEPIVRLGKSNMEAAIAIATIALQGTERLVDVQMKSAKEVVDEGMRSAKALSTAKNVQDLMALQAPNPQPHLEKALAYSRTVYEIAADTQTQISKLVSARLSDMSTELLSAFDKAIKAAPPGSEAALSAFKSAFTAANDAYGTMARAAREAGDIASNGVNSAAKATKKK